MSNRVASASEQAQTNGSDEAYCAIILAGQRPGADIVAAAHGLKAKALVPVLGMPMIDRVLQVLQDTKRFEQIIIVSNPSLEPITRAPGVAAAVTSGAAILMESESTISESVEAALNLIPPGRKGLVTTADNVLLSQAIIDAFLNKLTDYDVAVGVVDQKVIEARYPGIPRTYYRCADVAVSAANLFAFRSSSALPVIEFWKTIESKRKKPLSIAAAFGFWNLIGAKLRLFTLDTALSRASARIGAKIVPVLLPQAEAAIDVDKIIDHEIAEGILTQAALSSES